MTNKKTTKTDFSLRDFVQPIETKNAESEQFRVLSQLLDADKNLELKTEINKPFSFAVLNVYVKFLRENSFVDVAEMIENFIQNYFKLSISKKRAGRKEIIDALKSLGIQYQQSQLMNQIPQLPT